ncbi:hypothetical protein [Fulvivirga sediminis]|uniref:Uncharacterized protein n=1 Tax=Fulvivirga sediminis TaxID=2803949 RepID=A0A937FC28_9BACT|nr:hypothetical protein [Fulvivirga sediminis]MBL3658140.1 hypothetical protein [Fulvivirga sediminis]
MNNRMYGSLMALGACMLTIATAFVMPGIQIDAVFSSSLVSDFVGKYLINIESSDYCIAERIWVCAIYLFISLGIATGYFLILSQRKIGLLTLIVLLGIEFYLLQTPFFIFEVGSYYNCKSDGQTIMAIMASSPKVSLVLIGFGIIYDIVNNKRNKKTRD